MTDLERIARAIWADRAARILAEDIAGKTEDGSAGKLAYDELGEKFQAGLMSEARAAVQAAKELSTSLEQAIGLIDSSNDCVDCGRYPAAETFDAMCDAILNSENAA